MKCLNCGKNSLYRERSGGQCPGCRRRFAFEPKRGDPFTDGQFDKALKHLSQQGSLSYQPRQLYYELARLRHKKLPGKFSGAAGLTVAGVFLGGLLGLLFGGAFQLKPPGLVILLAIYACGWGLLVLRYWQKADFSLIRFEPKAFDSALKQWRVVHGEPAGLLSQPTVARLSAPEKDLLDYAVDRAIVCDHAGIAAFLIANNFHIEQKCAILSFDGHPAGRFDALRTLIRKNPQATVFLLHDASLNGSRLEGDISGAPDWFPQHRIYDIGLHPRHAQHFRGLWQKAPATGSAPERPDYTPDERAWLMRYQLELAALPPARLLKRLRNVLNGQARSVADAYARGDSDTGGDDGGDLFIGAAVIGWDDDFG